MNQNNKWGLLRETRQKADKDGIDPETGIHRTGLEEYLRVIFPEISESQWIQNKTVKGCGRLRPDYRCDDLRLIIEFDGTHHYSNPERIQKDNKNETIYKSLGYKVVRIPFFIQLTNEVIKIMFDRDVSEFMFNPTIPSMGKKCHNTPAYCCHSGLVRMAHEFKKYPQQYKVNIEYLFSQKDDDITGASLLKEFYEANDQ